MKNIALLLCVLFILPATLSAQSRQDILKQLTDSGISGTALQTGINNYNGGQESVSTQSNSSSSEARVTERIYEKVIEDTLNNKKAVDTVKIDPANTVFGSEIFNNQKLSFTPDINIPTPKDYIVSAGDELFIIVWGNSVLNQKLKVSPEGIILIPDLGPVFVAGKTVEAAENHIRNELGRIISSVSDPDAGGNTLVSVTLSQIRSIKVNIVGEVVAPGTYTLPSLATLFTALYLAGGVNDIGTLRAIKLYRNSREIACLDVYDYILNGRYDNNVRLEENDVIIVGTYDKHVVVRGEVKRNRIYEMVEGETLKQLLAMSGGFTGSAYKDNVQVKRQADKRFQMFTVPEQDFASFYMMDGDSLFVGEIVPMFENRVSVEGAVWRPGEYELSQSANTVKKLVMQAEGLKGDEFTGRAQISRLNPDFTMSLIAIDIVGIINGTREDIELLPEDKLLIPSLFDLREPYTITVVGAVNKPETFPYMRNMTVEDAIIIAGGLKESASILNVEVSRRLKNPESSTDSDRTSEVFTFPLTDNLNVAHGDNIFVLEPFDRVSIFNSPGYEEQQSIEISGEIQFVGTYALSKKNTRLSDIVSKAGGVTSSAYIKGASLQRKMSESEQASLKSMVEMSQNMQEDSLTVDLSDFYYFPVGIDLEQAMLHPGSVQDLVVRDGDKLFIPRFQSTVRISGSVIYPNNVVYSDGMTVKEALSQAGGYAGFAKKRPLVIYMNGKVATTRNILGFKSFPKLEPGCEIVVPARTNVRRLTPAEVMSLGASTTSMAALITSIIR